MNLAKFNANANSRILRTIPVLVSTNPYLRRPPTFGAATVFHIARVQPPKTTRQFSACPPLKMASDEDYMNFLDKANEDPNKGVAKSQSQGLAKAEFKTTDHGVEIPAALKEVTKDAFYVSDADEPFVPVALRWDEAGKGLPDEGMSRFISAP